MTSLTSLPWRRLVLWGLKDEFRDLHHVMAAFSHAGERLGLEVVWVNDCPESASAVQPGSILWAYDGACEHVPAVLGANYLLHNLGGHPILDRLPDASWILYQVYTDELLTVDGPAWGCTQWDLFTFFQAQQRLLFQPWGSDLLADEHLDPVWPGDSRVVNWVGSVWNNDLDQGNDAMIGDLRSVLADRGLEFVHHQRVSPETGVDLVRASRIAPAFTGHWQAAKGYLPCRYFKNITYGHLGLTNVTRLGELLGDAFVGGSIAAQVDLALDMGRQDYLETTREQQALVAPYNYAKKLSDVARAFQEAH